MENGVSALCRSSPPTLLGEANTIEGCFVGFVVPGLNRENDFFLEARPVKYRCDISFMIYRL